MKITAMLMASTALVVPFMSDVVPTLDIVTDAGNVRINASDYDAAKHTLAEGQEAPAQPAIATPPAPPAPPIPPGTVNGTEPPAPPAPPVPDATTPDVPVEKFVTKTGKKWFVTDKDGKPLDAAHTGFDTEAEAQAAAKPAVA